MSILDRPLGVPFQVSYAGEGLIWRMRCPKCGQLAELDDDQMECRVSTQCECGVHETVRWLDRIPHPYP